VGGDGEDGVGAVEADGHGELGDIGAWEVLRVVDGGSWVAVDVGGGAPMRQRAMWAKTMALALESVNWFAATLSNIDLCAAGLTEGGQEGEGGQSGGGAHDGALRVLGRGAA